LLAPLLELCGTVASAHTGQIREQHNAFLRHES
jgi:hypothetical protein